MSDVTCAMHSPHGPKNYALICAEGAWANDLEPEVLIERDSAFVLRERIDENRMGAVHVKTPVNGVQHHHGAVPLTQLRGIGNPDVNRIGAGGDLTPISRRVCGRVENNDHTHRRRGCAQVADPHFLPGRSIVL